MQAIIESAIYLIDDLWGSAGATGEHQCRHHLALNGLGSMSEATLETCFSRSAMFVVRLLILL